MEEKEIFDEKIKNWPDELEKIAEEANKKYIDFNSTYWNILEVRVA